MQARSTDALLPLKANTQDKHGSTRGPVGVFVAVVAPPPEAVVVAPPPEAVVVAVGVAGRQGGEDNQRDAHAHRHELHHNSDGGQMA